MYDKCKYDLNETFLWVDVEINNMLCNWHYVKPFTVITSSSLQGF